MYNSKLHVRSCADSFSVSTVHSILFYAHTSHNVCHYNTSMYFNTYLVLQRTLNELPTLVFFTTDHFILFVHSSRMFYYFVYLHVHVVGSCPAIVGCRPPACCLLACCHWGHRVVPFILECAQL